MLRHLRCCCVTVLFVLCVFVTHASAQPRIVDLGKPAGLENSFMQVLGVSADGKVLFGQVTLPHPDPMIAGFDVPFRWTTTDGFELLGTFPDGGDMKPHAINADGSVIVGEGKYLVPDGLWYQYSVQRPFRWSRATGIQDLFGVPSDPMAIPIHEAGVAYAVNGDGSAVSGARSVDYFENIAFHWRTDGVVDLPGVGAQVYRPVGVGPNGSPIVGWTGTPDRAFRWTPDTGMELFLPGTAIATAMNSDGSIVVGQRYTWGGFTWIPRAFRWTQAGGEQPLPQDMFLAEGVSEDGSVVRGPTYLWTESTGRISLVDYLTSFGVDLSGWYLDVLKGFSADASVLVGTGMYQGVPANWIAYLKSPKLEFVDPNPYSDPNFGAALGLEPFSSRREPTEAVPFTPEANLQRRTVKGVAADGVTRIAIRWQVPGAGTVSFSVADESGQQAAAGTLGRLHQRPSHPQIESVDAVQIEEQWYAFASYNPPLNFERNALDRDRFSRHITVTATYTPEGGGDLLTSEEQLELIRPPVLLVHGLNGSPGSWNISLQRDPRFIVHPADYSESNTDYFQNNLWEVRREAKRATRMAHYRGYAASQVTVVGHSMGGLLARLHAADRSYEYFRKDNLGQGDFYKIITLYSPHYGSPFACFTEAVNSWEIPGVSVVCPFDRPDCGALKQLRPDSNAIQTLPAIQVPTHVVAGVGGFETLLRWDGNMYVCALPTPVCVGLRALATLFYYFPLDLSLEHDLVVSRASALGGVSGVATTLVGYQETGSGWPVGTHVVEGQEFVSQQVIEPLIHADVDSPTFAGGIPQNTNVPVPSVCGDEPILPPERATDGWLEIILAESRGFEAGDTISVQLDLSGDFRAQKVTVLTEFGFVSTSSLSTPIELAIPLDVVGDFTLTAIAIDDAGRYIESNTLPITITSDATLEELHVITPWIGLGCRGEEQQLYVNGIFSNGVERDVTSSSSGTTYTSNNPQVVKVTAEGRVIARAEGTATISIQNDGVSSLVEVVVAPGWCMRKLMPKPYLPYSSKAACISAQPCE